MSTPHSNSYDPTPHGPYQGGPSMPGGEPQPGGTGAPGPSHAPDGENGFLSSLADIRFTKFVTPKVASVLYILMIVAIALGLLAWTVSSFGVMFSGEAAGVFMGLLMLVGGPIVALIYLVLARVSLESMVALVRVADDVAAIRRRG
ncbi:DUF4282 domain-containing protein [Kytococcus sp. Marseille-QA3725]